MRIMELVFSLSTKLLHQIFFLVSLSQVMCLPTLLGGDLKKMSGENKPEEAPVVFLCGWCFHGGPGGRQLRLKHLIENCFWFCCAQQFTIPRDGPKGHLLSLKKTPAVPVLAAFPAGSFLSIFVFLYFVFLISRCWLWVPSCPFWRRSVREPALPRALQQHGRLSVDYPCSKGPRGQGTTRTLLVSAGWKWAPLS